MECQGRTSLFIISLTGGRTRAQACELGRVLNSGREKGGISRRDWLDTNTRQVT